MDTATRTRGRYRDFTRAAAGEAVQAKDTPGNAPPLGAFLGGGFFLQLDRRPARLAHTTWRAERRTVIQHTLDRARFFVWLVGNNTRRSNGGHDDTVGTRGTLPFTSVGVGAVSFRKPCRSSSGSGNTMVLFFSAAISVNVCR